MVDVEGKSTPVPRHGLLISDNPTSAPPRRIVTTLDGTADVRLRPGNYTVESDEPLVFQGKAYQWRETLDIAAGRDATLELTTANADVEPMSPQRRVPRPQPGRWQTIPRRSWRSGMTALSRSGLRPRARPASWSTRTG